MGLEDEEAVDVGAGAGAEDVAFVEVGTCRWGGRGACCWLDLGIAGVEEVG